jgi:hypothetical protein
VTVSMTVRNGQRVDPDGPAPDPKPVRRNQRLESDRYCAQCGILWNEMADARQHRLQEHPEQARYERAPLERAP